MELLRALAALAEPPSPEHRRLAAVLELGEPPSAEEHDRVFLFELYPYASVYLGAEGMLGGEARDRVAGFWRALGAVPPPEADHLVAMLAGYSRLAELAAAADGGGRAARARHAFFWEHLAPWLPLYCNRAGGCDSPFYRRWAELLGRALRREAARLGAPPALSQHLRQAPELAAPEESGGKAFLAGLLAPVRCGMILSRADIGRASRDLDLPLRAGERRFALAALAGQEPRAVFSWLAAEATAWERRHGELGWPGVDLERFWRRRAAATAARLAALEL